MIESIETGLEFFRQVLELRAYRQEILSADIANASTPGFKAVDLDFAEALRGADKSRGSSPTTARAARLWLVDDARDLGEGGGKQRDSLLTEAAESVKYQIGNPVTLDGNSVSLDQEKVAAAENAVHYEAATTFASQTVKMLLTAINGAGPQQSGGG